MSERNEAAVRRKRGAVLRGDTAGTARSGDAAPDGTPAGSGQDATWDAEGVMRLRRFLGASQAQLADRLGTRQQTVSEWETGTSRPRRMSRRLLHLVAEESGYYAPSREPHHEGPPPGSEVPSETGGAG